MKRCSIAALLFSVLSSAVAADWPPGLSFIGLEKNGWKIYVVKPGDSKPAPIASATEPHTAAYHEETGRIAYVGADGTLYEIQLETGEEQTILAPDSSRAWTQPAYDESGMLFLVLLKKGNSADTDIVRLSGKGLDQVVSQRSAQLEPYASGTELFYSHVQCTVGCGNIIQDIWRKSLITGQARQLTRMNAIAREPSLSPDRKWVYFVSDKAGDYHIWRVPSDGGDAMPVTNGAVSDVSPALDKTGRLWFIRRTPQQSYVMVIAEDQEAKSVSLPKGVRDVRALEISP